MKKIAVVTATRAEYGLLTPLIKRIDEDDELDLDLIVTGTHLSEKQGHTIDEIRNDGFIIAHEISILEEDNTAYGISLTIANAIREFAACFRDDRPDMVVILGDRTEMLGVAIAAMNERIPIAHIHGGEVTEGAVDDCVRHALSKMSYLHFTSTEVYRNRVIQLGENPARVYNVGALGAENILKQKLMLEEEIRNILEIPLNTQYAVATFHPVTLEDNTIEQQIEMLCKVMEEKNDIFYIVTASNADMGGDAANAILKRYCENHENTRFFYSLGIKRYLSAVRYAAFMLGNSSSGILEAPVLGTPTVNIGIRQKGRLMTDTIINCGADVSEILNAIKRAEIMIHQPTNFYGDGTTSEKIVEIMKKHLNQKGINLKKGFYDMRTVE